MTPEESEKAAADLTTLKLTEVSLLQISLTKEPKLEVFAELGKNMDWSQPSHGSFCDSDNDSKMAKYVRNGSRHSWGYSTKMTKALENSRCLASEKCQTT